VTENIQSLVQMINDEIMNEKIASLKTDKMDNCVTY